MLRIMSDLNTTFRVEVPWVAATHTSHPYVQGRWLTGDGNVPSAGNEIALGPIFNMGDTTGGMSSDTLVIAGIPANDTTMRSTRGGSGTLTLIAGQFRGVTDQIQSGQYANLTAGAGFTINASGLLAPATEGADHVYGTIIAQHSTFEHRGATYSQVVEFVRN